MFCCTFFAPHLILNSFCPFVCENVKMFFFFWSWTTTRVTLGGLALATANSVVKFQLVAGFRFCVSRCVQTGISL